MVEFEFPSTKCFKTCRLHSPAPLKSLYILEFYSTAHYARLPKKNAEREFLAGTLKKTHSIIFFNFISFLIHIKSFWLILNYTVCVYSLSRFTCIRSSTNIYHSICIRIWTTLPSSQLNYAQTQFPRFPISFLRQWFHLHTYNVICISICLCYTQFHRIYVVNRGYILCVHETCTNVCIKLHWGN